MFKPQIYFKLKKQNSTVYEKQLERKKRIWNLNVRKFAIFRSSGLWGRLTLGVLTFFLFHRVIPFFSTFHVLSPHKDLYSTVKFSETVVQGLEGLRRKFEDLSNECGRF